MYSIFIAPSGQIKRLLLLMLLAVVALVLLLAGCSSKKDNGAGTASGPAGTAAQDESNLVRCPLTGEKVTETALQRRPLAVMIENSPAARPQSGLNKADIVYEMLAEGDITRFMAVFLHGDAGELGPVRSARPYFIERALDYNAVYVHCGGSEAAKQMVSQEQVAHLDEFSIGRRAFWRVRTRKAPHNLYTDTEKLRRVAAQKGYEEMPEITPFRFSEAGETAAAGRASAGPTIHYPRVYNVAMFKYDNKQKLYKRYTGGRPHKDSFTGEQLTARNIIVQYVNTKVIDEAGRRAMNMEGSGRALLFTGGKVYEGRWNKAGLRSRTVFSDEYGEEFKLNPGQTWIEVVPQRTRVDA